MRNRPDINTQIKNLQAAIEEKNSPSFLTILGKTSLEAINQALVLQDNNQWTVLHSAARDQTSEGFKALIEKASSEAVSQALTLQNHEQLTVLHIAARDQTSEGFKALIEKASPEAINQALVLQDNEQWTVLHLAARYQSSDGLKILIEIASPEVINKALVLPNKDQWTVLHLAARYQSLDGLKILIEIASPEVINKALVLPNKDQWTVLHLAARHQNPEGFKALIEKASSEAVSQALTLQNHEQWTVLHLAARHQSPENFKALVEKASTYAICTAILKNNTFENAKPENLTLIIDKAPASLMLLKDPRTIKTHTQDFITLHKKIFNDELNGKSISLADCNAWLVFLNEALVHAPDEQTRNLVEASCMRLSWIASFKTENKAEKEAFQKNALAHLKKIISPERLSISDNQLAFELLSSSEKKRKGLQFLHQAVIDANDNEVKQSTTTLLLTNVYKILNPQSKIDEDNIPAEITKEQWTADAEEQYQKAVYYLQVKKYIRTLEKLTASFNEEVISSCNEQEKKSARDLHHELTTQLSTIKQFIDTDKKPDEVHAELKKFQEACLPKANDLMQIMEKDLQRKTFLKTSIVCLKKLIACIVAIPKFILSPSRPIDAYTRAYRKNKKHLFSSQDNIKKTRKMHGKLANQKVHTPPRGSSAA